MIDFLYGIALTLLLETVALMIATAWLRRKLHE
jgi:hypothetical protein